MATNKPFDFGESVIEIQSITVPEILNTGIETSSLGLTTGAGDNSVGVDSSGTNPAFYAGSADPATAPFRVSTAGALVATSATITGSITATSGTIGGWDIGATTITGSSGTVGMSSAVTAGDDIRFFAGNATPASAPFRVTEAGVLTATSALLGGWTVDATSIYTGTEDHSGYTANAGDITIYSNGTDASIHAKNFYIDTAGNLTCNTATVAGAITTNAGSSLDGQYLVATSVNSAATNLALRGWTFTGVFSSTDADTVAWTAGTFTDSAGTAYSIDAGNTGNIVALNYIYLDIAVSETVLQKTTTAATAIGNGKVLIAVAQNNSDATSKAVFQVFGGTGGERLLVDNLAANSASTNEFISNTAQIANLVVTSAKINDLAVDKLTAGSITSKAITLAVADGTGDSKIQAGKTDFTNTDAGFILGIDDSDSNKGKLYIGDSTNYLNWDGTNLILSGYMVKTKGSFGGNGADGALTISSGTTTIDLDGATLVEKNYTSISITSTGKLAFSNPHANGTVINLRSQGDVTLTSSTVPLIDVSELGAAGATAGASGGGNGASGNMMYYHINGATTVAGAGSTGSTTGSTGGASAVAALTNPKFYIFDATSLITLHASTRFLMACGTGGGSSGGGTGITGADGGRGGGVLLIECGGALNSTGTIYAKGGVGGTGNGGTASTGGGGGGSGGTIAIFYNTLTGNSGTYTVSGGNGGNGGPRAAQNTGATGGGSGGSSIVYVGGAGGSGENNTNSTNNAGGAGGSGANGSDGTSASGGSGYGAAGGGGGGASGQSLVIQNIWIS